MSKDKYVRSPWLTPTPFNQPRVDLTPAIIEQLNKLGYDNEWIATLTQEQIQGLLERRSVYAAADLTPETLQQLKDLGWPDDQIQQFNQAEVNAIIKYQQRNIYTAWAMGTAAPPEYFNVPFRETPDWLQQAWNNLHPRTVPLVEVYRTPVARIDPPGNDFYVRDIVAHKGGRVMSRYVPSYDSLSASTPQDQSLYFGGAVNLAPDEGIAVMDFWGDRYKHIDLYVHPQAYEPPQLLGPDLTDRQKKILAAIRSYTSAYRKELFRQHNVIPEELEALQSLGLIDRRNAITVMGRNVIGNEQAWF